jgi:hypothetical protein
MIKNITGYNGVRVNGVASTWPAFYNTPTPTIGIGSMRYNGNSRCIEVSDGTNWMMLADAQVSIELDSFAKSAIDWAHTKMAKELELQKLAAKHPAVAEALAAVTHAEEQVRIVAALVDTA